MTLYEERLKEDMSVIRSKVQNIADRVCAALQDAVEAIEKNDRDVLNDVVLNDYGINRDTRCIDRLCHEFVARHLPAAGHLRFISAVLRLTIALERAGDYAVTISRVALQLVNPLSPPLIAKVQSMTSISTKMLADATKAFLNGDAKLAVETKKLDFQVDKTYDEAFEAMLEEGKIRDLKELLTLLKIASKVERFSDQAKNICEEAVFAATGELKPPKVVHLLFLDEGDDYITKLAEAIANKAFPNSGIYSSAGINPAPKFHPDLEKTAEQFGFKICGPRPGRVGNLHAFPMPFHLVVAINLKDESQLPSLSYHTILRKWRVSASKENPRQLIEELSSLIRDLIEKVRGKDAD